jgi:hypothetical protein
MNARGIVLLAVCVIVLMLSPMIEPVAQSGIIRIITVPRRAARSIPMLG